MSTASAFRVVYHFEKSGKRASETQIDNLIAADSTYSSLSTVLSNNNKTNGGNGTLVIENVTGIHGNGNFLT